jgi:hypothetical protein
MSFAAVRQSLLRDFVLCVEAGNVPPLNTYFAHYVKDGCTAAADDYRLVPITASASRFANTSSGCLTDCLFDLQSKYQQLVPDDWGGHVEKGSRDIATIGFNIREGVVLDIQEIQEATAYVDWARPKLDSLAWQNLLIHAVVEFGRYCHVQQVCLQPQYESSAKASGFVYDKALGCFVSA